MDQALALQPVRSKHQSQHLHSTQEWEEHHERIERLYCTEDKPLKEVRKVMEHDFRFYAT
jgi:Clr5 domain